MSYSITNKTDFPLKVEFKDENGKGQTLKIPSIRTGNDYSKEFNPNERHEIKFISKGKKEIYFSFNAGHKEDGKVDHIDGQVGHPGGGNGK